MTSKKSESSSMKRHAAKQAVKAKESARAIKEERNAMMAEEAAEEAAAQENSPAWKGTAVEGAPRFKSEDDVAEYKTEETTEAADQKEANAINTLLEGESPKERESILRDLLEKEIAKNKKKSDVNPDEELSPDWRNGAYPYQNRLRRKVYEQQKFHLQVELLKMQSWIKETGAKLLILFEGRDAAGKGGTIKRFTEHLNPRGAHIIALDKPTPKEQGQWYFQRYVPHLPTKGEIILFDRSWYNRAGVERVMGFCTDEEYQEFMRECPEFERNLVRSGIYLIKFWFSVSQKEQRRRFHERQFHPLKRWKLSPVDMASLDKWDDYTRAKEAMFFVTDTPECPWTVVKSDDKKRARLNAMRYVLHRVPYADRDLKVIGPVDPLIVSRPNAVLREKVEANISKKSR
ncbi:MAG: polyphosphate kinase 2 [Duodenibacillus sp.]|nr:polyphosphate kinase 2 [Duodenibacillus sp.]